MTDLSIPRFKDDESLHQEELPQSVAESLRLDPSSTTKNYESHHRAIDYLLTNREEMVATIKEQGIVITELRGTVVQQGIVISQQGIVITQQGLLITELQGEFGHVKDKFDQMEKRDVRITVREAMTLLELEMCKEMFTNTDVSKTPIKKNFLFTAKYIYSCLIPQVVDARTACMERYNLLENHIFAIVHLNNSGTKECHFKHPVLLRTDWNVLMTDLSEPEDLTTHLALLDLLEIYRPVSEDGKWPLKVVRRVQLGLA